MIFYALIDLCKATNKTYLLNPYLPKIELILPWTKLTLDEKVEVYLKVFKILKNSTLSETIIPQIIQFFNVFNGAEKEQVLKHKETISSCLVDIIESDEYIFELGELICLDQIKLLLEEEKDLGGLIESILRGEVQRSDDLYKSNGALLEAAGISEEDLKNKIRYSLITSIADHNKSMDFKELSEKLDCQEEDIEVLFITSIEYGFIDALIDESKKMVYFR